MVGCAQIATETANFVLAGVRRFCYQIIMIIGQRLQELRTARGWSQGDIEKRTGLFRCYISRVENGHTIPSLETLERLATAFEIELYQLFFTGDGKPKQVSGSKPAASDLGERKLLDAYRALDERNRQLVLSMTRKLASRG